MPNNIIITPGSASIQFSGSANNDTIRLQVEPSGSVAFYGNSGSLFSIVDQLSGSLMSVNDISGLPILEVFSDDRVVMGSFGRNTLVVSGSTVTVSGSLSLSGSANVTSSWALSSSRAVTASFALNAGGGAGFPFTGSAGLSGSLFITGSATSPELVVVGESVFTGSVVMFGSTQPELTVIGETSLTGSLSADGDTLMITGSILTNADTLIFTGSFNSTGSFNLIADANTITLTGSILTTADTLIFSGSSFFSGSTNVIGQLVIPTTSSVSPQVGSMFFSSSFIYVYDGVKYRSASLF